MNPKVSVIVPVFNVEKYLAKCLDSLVNQSIDSIEIIVVNDGSTDKSREIIERYHQHYPERIIPIDKPNGGLSDARNYGLKHAKADFIGFVDSDDYVELDMFQTMFTEAINAEADLVICDIEYFWENSEKKIYMSGLKRIDKLEMRKALFLSPLFAWNKLYHRHFFDDYDMKYPLNVWYEDLPVTLPVFALAKKVSYIDKPLIHYLQRKSSIMNTKNSTKLKDILTVLDLVNTYFESHNLKSFYNDELEYLHIEQLLLFGGFRMMRSKDYNKLMQCSLSMMRERYPNWKKNRYIDYLDLRYRIYLKAFSALSYHLYRWLILINDLVNERV